MDVGYSRVEVLTGDMGEWSVVFRTCILTVCLAASLFAANRPSATPDSAPWSSKAAATYLDGRLTWWMGWPVAARDHETFCVSCHTVLPYAMARPALREALAEQAPSFVERKLLDNVTKRVQMWQDVEPFYPDAKRGVPKTEESRGNRIHSQRSDTCRLWL
jgi:squalene-hopene/tetraprenyl-beta-curcumene cyclase